jgi:hypothetical protein
MPKTRRNQKKCGGGSTSEYGTYVWGTGNQQHAIGNGSNLIAAVNDPQSYTGGKRRSVKKGGDLATIAVPAVLIAANQLYKPKKHLRDIKKGGADLADLSKMMANAQQAAGALTSGTPTPTPQHQTVNVTQLPNVTAGIAKVVGGNLVNGQVLLDQSGESVEPLDQSGDQLVVGSGILTDIAAPAVLIAANHLYNPKRRQSKKNKRRTSRKSRRV